jgi:hypothetical protein
MTPLEIQQLTDALCARERANFNLDVMCDNAVRHCSGDPEIAASAVEFMKAISMIVWERGFYQGAQAGLELAQEIRRSMMKEPE